MMGSSDNLLQPLMLSWGTWRTCLWIRLTPQRCVPGVPLVGPCVTGPLLCRSLAHSWQGLSLTTVFHRCTWGRTLCPTSWPSWLGGGRALALPLMLVCPLCRAVFKRANLLVSMKHGMSRLDSVWGVGGGQWPVKTLVRQVLVLSRCCQQCV